MSIFRVILTSTWLLLAGESLAEEPKRIVSVNLCADQFAMLLVGPEQLLTVTFLSQDPMNSAMSEEAQKFPSHHAKIEEIVLMRPDLVLAHEWTSPLLLAMLERFEIPYFQVITPHNLDEIPQVLRQIGKILGQEEKAEELSLNFLERLALLDERSLKLDHTNTIALYGPNGWMGGTNSITGSLLQRSGFDPIADDYGLENGGFMPLELLIAAKPDLILTPKLYGKTSRGEALLRHPALAQINQATLNYENTLSCGTPQILEAYNELLDLKEGLKP